MVGNVSFLMFLTIFDLSLLILWINCRCYLRSTVALMQPSYCGHLFDIQCFDAVGWAAVRASGLVLAHLGSPGKGLLNGCVFV